MCSSSRELNSRERINVARQISRHRHLLCTRRQTSNYPSSSPIRTASPERRLTERFPLTVLNYCRKDRLETIVPGLVLLLQVKVQGSCCEREWDRSPASNAYRLLLLLLLLLQLCGGKSLLLDFFFRNAISVVSYLVVSTSSQWHRLPGRCTFVAPWNYFNTAAL